MVGALAVALIAAASTDATYSVAVTRQVGLDSAAALELADLFSLALERQGEALPGKRISARAFAASLAAASTDPVSCAGALDCAVVLGKVGKVDWLFAVQLAKVGSNVIFDANLIRVHDGTSLASVNKAVRFKEPVPDLEVLAKELVALAQPLQLPPREPELAMTTTTDPIASPPPTAQPLARDGLGTGELASLGLAGLAIAAVAGGAVLGTTALVQADALSSRAATYAEDSARVLWIARGADIAYVAGGGLAAAALLVWLVLGQAPAEDTPHQPALAGSASDAL